MSNRLKGGLGDKATLKTLSAKHSVTVEYLQYQIGKGLKVEMEHTNDRQVAMEIVMDHLSERPDYYEKLEQMEQQPKNTEWTFPKEKIISELKTFLKQKKDRV